MSRSTTENPRTALAQLNARRDSGTWSEKTLIDSWANALRQIYILTEINRNAMGKELRDSTAKTISEWRQLVVDPVWESLTFGARKEAEIVRNRITPDPEFAQEPGFNDYARGGKFKAIQKLAKRVTTPLQAKDYIKELRIAEFLSDATLTPLWIYAKRREYEAATSENLEERNAWEEVATAVSDYLTPGAYIDVQADLAQLYPDMPVVKDAPEKPKKKGPAKPRAPKVGATGSLLAVLTKIFTLSEGKTFLDLSQPTRALYESMWKLTQEERLLFIRVSRRDEITDPPEPLTTVDRSLIGAWLVELFRKTYKNTREPSELLFSSNYASPVALSASGQLAILRLIGYFFSQSPGLHSGGISSALQLSDPNWAAIKKFNTSLAEALQNPFVFAPRENEPQPMQVSPLSSGFSSASSAPPMPRPKRTRPFDEDEDEPEIMLDPPSDDEMDDDTKPASSAGPSRAGNFVAITSEMVGGVVSDYDLGGLLIDTGFIATSIYSRRILSEIENWMVRADKPLPESLSEAERSVEGRINARLSANYTRFKNLRKELLDVIKVERDARRLRMSDATYDLLVANINTIEDRFIGLYRAKGDLLLYIQQQLTGTKPRAPTANHILGTGEPGTGKTTMMQIVGSIMISLGLIEAPTLRTYEMLGKTLEGNVTTAEYERISDLALPDGVPPLIDGFLSRSAQFALRAAKIYDEGGEGHPRPAVYDPSKFNSVFDNGTMTLFMFAVFRSVGSSMIIDEAYELKNEKLSQVVEALVGLITQLETQWSTVLLGYEDKMNEFFRVSNPGLNGRYDTRIRFGFYSAVELTAILAQMICTSDNLALVSEASDIRTYATMNENSASLKSHIYGLLDSLYAAMGPYATRGPRGSLNQFGSDNVRAVQKLFSVLGASHSKPSSLVSTLKVITPSSVKDALLYAISDKRPFGRWSNEELMRTTGLDEEAPQTPPVPPAGQ